LLHYSIPFVVSEKIHFVVQLSLFVCASLSMAGLGLYGSIETIIATFKTAKAVSFGCATP